MKIINAQKEHLDDVYNLICELENSQLNKSDFTQVYMNNLENKDVHYFLSVDGDTVIGFLSLHIQQLLHHSAKIGEIQEFIIAEEYCENGAGTELFAYVKKTA